MTKILSIAAIMVGTVVGSAFGYGAAVRSSAMCCANPCAACADGCDGCPLCEVDCRACCGAAVTAPTAPVR